MRLMFTRVGFGMLARLSAYLADEYTEDLL